MSTPLSSSDVQKLLSELEDSVRQIRVADDLGNTRHLLMEARYLQEAIPHVLEYVRSLEKEQSPKS